MKTLQQTLWQAANLPEHYQCVNEQLVQHDDTTISWQRYQAEAPMQFGTEHVSLTFVDNKLFGFTHMNANLRCGELPSEAEAKRIACDFISEFASDLVGQLEFKWVAVHEEIIHVDDKDVVNDGMKVKCRINSSGKYAWVIVGSNRCPITFERDIIWNFDMSHRQTEKWLHDSWLKEENNNAK